MICLRVPLCAPPLLLFIMQSMQAALGPQAGKKLRCVMATSQDFDIAKHCVIGWQRTDRADAQFTYELGLDNVPVRLAAAADTKLEADVDTRLEVELEPELTAAAPAAAAPATTAAAAAAAAEEDKSALVLSLRSQLAAAQEESAELQAAMPEYQSIIEELNN